MIHAVAFVAAGWASFYTRESTGGHATATGAAMSDSLHTCATRHLVPYGTRLRIINDKNSNESWCIVNDYGPRVSTGRIIDVSLAVARDLDMVSAGVVRVRIYKSILVKGRQHADCPRGVCAIFVTCLAPGICKIDDP